MRSFKDLEAWKVGMELCELVYAISGGLPDDERFGLTRQMKRAAVSIPSNVAEGFKRNNKAEFRQFLGIASGSLAELETQLILSQRLNFIVLNDTLTDKLDHTGRLLTALRQSLER